MATAEALAYLASLAPSTIRMGLERVQAALERLDHPERRFPAIHVAGTNGKGSTCAMIASCLGQRYRVGFYSSPHLVRVNERFRVDGRDITDGTLARRIDALRERLGDGHELTYFEFGTVLAFWHFAQEAVDVAVIETGLGGRLDATVTCAPIVTAITAIDFDHMEFLGTTLPAIAGEKAGIVKGGVPVVIARQRPEVLEVFERAAAASGSRLIVEGREVEFRGDTFRGVGRAVQGLSLPLQGAHQSQNAGVALGCLEAIDSRFPLREAELREGFAATRWPGRLQEIAGSPTLLLDGAHNPAGVEVLVQALERFYSGRQLQLVFGVFADKDSEPMMRRLFPLAQRVVLTPLHSPRSKDPASYETFARTLAPDVVQAGSVADALKVAEASADAGGVVVVAGSLHLVGEALAALEADFEALLSRLSSFEPGDDPEETMRALAASLVRARPALDPLRFRAEALALLERFPDAEFGTPGALVHELERHGVSHAELAASLERQPTFLTVSMVNRAMNLTDEPLALGRWRVLLERVDQHPRAPDWVRTAARRYLEHQAAR
ncbi:MAG: folylpolyglutamate synthase/dihydrofolate synthase family protein [Myxococcaceae bacterium]|nr:folylpolyglutamate synthase/dihydrofolate synthase family protein [Myxococcaceae bacterium]